MSTSLMEARGLGKSFDSGVALADVSLRIERGEVHCLLGDNGAGKSTLIKILCGVHTPSRGTLRFEGRDVAFASPRDALECGIAAVYQDLALLPLMSITRNFFLAREPTRGWGPWRRVDWRHAHAVAQGALRDLGVHVHDSRRVVGTLSGGERQSLAIARAVHFGAKLLILDEPTAALGVVQTTRVLQVVRRLRDRGLGIVLITHNVRHAYAVADRFSVLDRGHLRGTFARDAVDVDALQDLMAGGQSVDAWSRELG